MDATGLDLEKRWRNPGTRMINATAKVTSKKTIRTPSIIGAPKLHGCITCRSDGNCSRLKSADCNSGFRLTGQGRQGRVPVFPAGHPNVGSFHNKRTSGQAGLRLCRLRAELMY